MVSATSAAKRGSWRTSSTAIDCPDISAQPAIPRSPGMRMPMVAAAPLPAATRNSSISSASSKRAIEHAAASKTSSADSTIACRNSSSPRGRSTGPRSDASCARPERTLPVEPLSSMMLGTLPPDDGRRAGCMRGDDGEHRATRRCCRTRPCSVGCRSSRCSASPRRPYGARTVAGRSSSVRRTTAMRSASSSPGSSRSTGPRPMATRCCS